MLNRAFRADIITRKCYLSKKFHQIWRFARIHLRNIASSFVGSLAVAPSA